MLRGGSAEVDVGQPEEVARLYPAAGGQHTGYGPGGFLGRQPRRHVHLDPAAGGQDEDLIDSGHGMHPGQHADALSGQHGKLLEYSGRGSPVGDADIHNRHGIDRSVWAANLGENRSPRRSAPSLTPPLVSGHRMFYVIHAGSKTARRYRSRALLPTAAPPYRWRTECRVAEPSSVR